MTTQCDGCLRYVDSCVTRETCHGERHLCTDCAQDYIMGDDQLYHPVGDGVRKLREAIDAMRGATVTIKGNSAILLGEPTGEHNCDEMGCSSVNGHVLARLFLDPDDYKMISTLRRIAGMEVE